MKVKFMKKNFKLVKIKKVEVTEETCEMCDLEVSQFNNFVLDNGIVTHNSSNLEVNILRQADFLILKPSSLLQKEFERKIIQKIYEETENDFKKSEDKQGLTFIYSDKFKGFVTNELPSFWGVKISKSFSGK